VINIYIYILKIMNGAYINGSNCAKKTNPDLCFLSTSRRPSRRLVVKSLCFCISALCSGAKFYFPSVGEKSFTASLTVYNSHLIRRHGAETRHRSRPISAQSYSFSADHQQRCLCRHATVSFIHPFIHSYSSCY